MQVKSVLFFLRIVTGAIYIHIFYDLGVFRRFTSDIESGEEEKLYNLTE